MSHITICITFISVVQYTVSKYSCGLRLFDIFVEMITGQLFKKQYL